jgi:hypothetical protein
VGYPTDTVVALVFVVHHACVKDSKLKRQMLVFSQSVKVDVFGVSFEFVAVSINHEFKYLFRYVRFIK